MVFIYLDNCPLLDVGQSDLFLEGYDPHPVAHMAGGGGAHSGPQPPPPLLLLLSPLTPACLPTSSLSPAAGDFLHLDLPPVICFDLPNLPNLSTAPLLLFGSNLLFMGTLLDL